MVTGIKYLGKTVAKDPSKYKGSGKYWEAHLKKHGNIVKTEILKECATSDEIKYWGKYYSELWNVVDSDDWANLKPEEGDGGYTGEPWNKGKKMTAEYCEKLKQAVQNRTEETKQHMIESGKRSYEKTFALLTPAERKEKYNNSLGKMNKEQRQLNGRISGKKGGTKWSNASKHTTTVTDKAGKSKRISTSLYNDMKSDMLKNNIPTTEWQYVQVSSLESKRRKQK
jgi:hypothetical protein